MWLHFITKANTSFATGLMLLPPGGKKLKDHCCFQTVKMIQECKAPKKVKAAFRLNFINQTEFDLVSSA